MDIVRATQQDIELLRQTRVAFLRSFRGFTAETEEQLRRELAADYTTHLGPAGGLVALLGKEGDTIVSSAFMSVYERPPTDRLLSRRYGRLTNIYTYPEHRGRGHAKVLVKAILDIARQEGLASVELNASDGGLALYRSLGFKMQDGVPMWLACM